MNFFAALLLLAASWIPVQGGEWTPSTEMVRSIRSNLETFVVAESTARHISLPTRFTNYTFQYQGQESNGRKFVLINAFCQRPKSNLQAHFYFVDDGGPCFFTAKYDPSTKEFYELAFNGDA
jgi:hypothetical protein